MIPLHVPQVMMLQAHPGLMVTPQSEMPFCGHGRQLWAVSPAWGLMWCACLQHCDCIAFACVYNCRAHDQLPAATARALCMLQMYRLLAAACLVTGILPSGLKYGSYTRWILHDIICVQAAGMAASSAQQLVVLGALTGLAQGQPETCLTALR